MPWGVARNAIPRDPLFPTLLAPPPDLRPPRPAPPLAPSRPYHTSQEIRHQRQLMVLVVAWALAAYFYRQWVRRRYEAIVRRMEEENRRLFEQIMADGGANPRQG